MTDTDSEKRMIVLPCSHLIERPPDHGGTVTCHCDRIWHLRPDSGGRSWNAQEIT